MSIFTKITGLITVLVLGLTAGAMLTEAVIIVPFWLSLSPTEFFDWYSKNQAALVNYYSPLEIWSVILTLVTSILLLITKQEGKLPMVASTVLSILVIVTFFIFFKDANASFNTRSIAHDKLASAIITWGNWQWLRVGLGIAAFIFGLFAIQSAKK
ncbi:DUF1772 domain-containing protein [Leptospira neocaledonica]|uniref:DUF1772 domain-containing protein n=1 Tax=Leptospira neocaledonica TaxID=2023192 RepID=A0A2M9ZW80_9LEPT|nr:DUF1772 domain-containing protein [Leptospira neocaledonica]PJZ76328.1 hypothetical protein CH365_13110 [Leptospira neocaledonica]